MAVIHYGNTQSHLFCLITPLGLGAAKVVPFACAKGPRWELVNCLRNPESPDTSRVWTVQKWVQIVCRPFKCFVSGGPLYRVRISTIQQIEVILNRPILYCQIICWMFLFLKHLATKIKVCSTGNDARQLCSFFLAASLCGELPLILFFYST